MPLDWFTQGFQASSNGTRALGLLGQTANTQQQQSDWLQPRNSNVKINWRPKFSGAHAELMMITKLTKTIWMKKKKSSATCCITGALEHQEDFHQQDKTALFKIIQEAGHLCFFLPKFHSELNPIERYWAILKVHTRRNCRFNINAVERSMLSAVNQDFGDYIKRIFETSLRYVLLYAAGLDDQNAKKVSDAISDARQTLKKVHCFIWSL